MNICGHRRGFPRVPPICAGSMVLSGFRPGFVFCVSVRASEGIQAPESTVQQCAQSQTVLAILAALALALLLFLLLKTVFHSMTVILALGLALLTAWVVHPLLTPHIEQWMLQASESNARSPSAATNDLVLETTAATNPPAADLVQSLETRIVEVLRRQPDPRVVSFAASFIVLFLLYSIPIGAAVRWLRPQPAR